MKVMVAVVTDHVVVVVAGLLCKKERELPPVIASDS